MQYCKTPRLFGDLKAFVWRVEYRQRGFPHAHILFWTDGDISDIQEIDKLVNLRSPESSSVSNEQEMTKDCKMLIREFQIHYHTRHCGNSAGQRKFGYPQAVSQVTRCTIPQTCLRDRWGTRISYHIIFNS
jgi:hypothetical protein